MGIKLVARLLINERKKLMERHLKMFEETTVFDCAIYSLVYMNIESAE
jgi:hypothetical protein